jgi:hypothetical protein
MCIREGNHKFSVKMNNKQSQSNKLLAQCLVGKLSTRRNAQIIILKAAARHLAVRGLRSIASKTRITLRMTLLTQRLKILEGSCFAKTQLQGLVKHVRWRTLLHALNRIRPTDLQSKMTTVVTVNG